MCIYREKLEDEDQSESEDEEVGSYDDLTSDECQTEDSSDGSEFGWDCTYKPDGCSSEDEAFHIKYYGTRTTVKKMHGLAYNQERCIAGQQAQPQFDWSKTKPDYVLVSVKVMQNMLMQIDELEQTNKELNAQLKAEYLHNGKVTKEVIGERKTETETLKAPINEAKVATGVDENVCNGRQKQNVHDFKCTEGKTICMLCKTNQNKLDEHPQMTEQHAESLKKAREDIQAKSNEITELRKEIADLRSGTKCILRDPGCDSNDKRILEYGQEDALMELASVRKELEETKTRLSRVMGDRLTDNNPNIADLSDSNRPTKLSERFQELYDNQWTDAFEVVDEMFKDEEKTINTLKNILLDVVNFCKTEAENQMKRVKEVFTKGRDIPVSILKPLKDYRKALAETYGKELFKEYIAELRKSDTQKIAEKIPAFVKESFEICWLMSVQDPPVVVGPYPCQGEQFNKDEYKVYTKSGDQVSYVVWPVLFLHQGGPVLCKGVVQCQKSLT